MNQSQKLFEKPQEGQPWDVIIIGSGPAALTAAIYTTRGAASTLIIGGDNWGGQLMLTTTVDNYPGFPQGIQGPDLMKLFRTQAERFGTELIEQKAVKVNFKRLPFEVSTQDKTYKGKTVIVATGAEARWLGVPGEERLRGRGVSSCAPCDAPFFKDKKTAVIGGGDAAMEEALVLTKYSSQVTIIHRRDKFRASEIMQKKVLSHPKIKVLWNTEVKEFIGEEKLQLLKIINNKTNQESEYPVDGAFVAIGHNPATQIFQDQLKLDEKGYILKDSSSEFQMSTSVPGVFVAGDVHDYHYRQAITAAGFGCMAALETLKYLDKPSPVY